MHGQLVIGGPEPLRWGSGEDGSATWSGQLQRSGVYQFTTLNISSNTFINITTSGNFKNGLVIFATNKVTIGDDVVINSSPGTNNYQKNVRGTGGIWKANGADISWGYSFTGGGGGGGGGCNCCGQNGTVGNNPALFYTNNLGTSFTNLAFDPGGAAGYGAGRCNALGFNGGNSSVHGSASAAHIKQYYNFTGGKHKDSGGNFQDRDDFPVTSGGDGGRGGYQYSSLSGNRGTGGQGAGMIQIIAPRIEFGQRVLLYARGQSREPAIDLTGTAPDAPTESGFGGQGAGGSNFGSTNHGMNAQRSGDGGGGAGGAGGGGFVGLVYSKRVGIPTVRVYSAQGGMTAAGGNRGGRGGNGAYGLILFGYRNVNSGPITWEYEDSNGIKDNKRITINPGLSRESNYPYTETYHNDTGLT